MPEYRLGGIMSVQLVLLQTKASINAFGCFAIWFENACVEAKV